MAYQYLLPQVPYYGPTYAYMPTMNVNGAFPGMSPMQCMDSCCSPPVTSAFLSSDSCTGSCCAGSTPDIIINNPSGNLSINNPESICMDSCCSTTPPICVDSCCTPAMYGMPSLYEDTCNTTSTYYYSKKPSVRYKKDSKGSYTSYGNGCMMM